MIRKMALVITLILGLAASLIAAVLMRILAGPMSWLAFAGWVIFFLSLQSSLMMQAARTGQLDACSARLFRWFSNR